MIKQEPDDSPSGSGGTDPATTPVRLDSLSRRPGKKFAPKIVARRTKQERDATAPPDIVEPPVTVKPKIDARARRNRNNMRSDQISAPAVGPLASASGRGPRFASPINASGAFQLPRRVKSETPDISDEGQEPDNPLHIDMSSNDKPGPESLHFPIRLERIDLAADDDADAGLKSEAAQAEDAVRKAVMDGVLQYRSPQELKELERINDDHKVIMDEFLRQDGSGSEGVSRIEQQLYFFQFPVVMPRFSVPEAEYKMDLDVEEVKVEVKDQNNKVKRESSETAGEVKPEIKNEEPSEEARAKIPAGVAGKLRLHKSGKLTMTLGNIAMEVSQGTASSYLQDVVVLDDTKKKAYLVGQVSRKMVVAPDLDSRSLDDDDGLNKGI